MTAYVLPVLVGVLLGALVTVLGILLERRSR